MRNVARLPDSDRGELFRNTADKMGLNDAIVEKDFWACFTLDHLFHRCPWKDAITFKGGTSLSKAFNLISRFSEDIDLILDWRVLGYGKDEPWEKRSNTKQDAFNKEANTRAEVFLAEQFCPTVQAEFSRELGCEANIYIDEKDKQTVIFAYPHLFTNPATLQVIRLEIGALAAWTPAKIAQIEPYTIRSLTSAEPVLWGILKYQPSISRCRSIMERRTPSFKLLSGIWNGQAFLWEERIRTVFCPGIGGFRAQSSLRILISWWWETNSSCVCWTKC